MQSSQNTTSGPVLDPGVPSGATTSGTGWVIGDGVTLTAGHVVFEYNRSTSNPQIVDGTNSIFLDFNGYSTAYLQAVQNHITNGTMSSSLLNGHIEAEIIVADAVAINQGGDVNQNHAGLAWFIDTSDLTSVSGILASATLTRYGNTTGSQQGSVTSVGANGVFRFSPGSNLGDSGGAYVVENTATGKGFVFGSQSSQPGSNGIPNPSLDAYGVALTSSDFFALIGQLEAGQSGDVSTSEPTNLIVGSTSGNTVAGTYRSDIVLGRAGVDTIADGDQATDSVYANDMLFGGEGNDTLSAGKGNDLLHGGDSHDYTASGEKKTLEDDGNDTVNYASVVTRGASDKGLTVFVAPLGTSGVPNWTFGDTTDQSSAVYVVDQAAATVADHIGSDTLVSIEEISLTDADDILRLDVISGNSDQFAGSDGKGGIAKIDLKGNAQGSGKGDLIDASKSNVNWKIDLSSNSNNVVDTNKPNDVVLTVLGAERVITADGKDEIIGNDEDNEFTTGKGDDTVTGGKGDDKIDGGDDDDVAVFSGNCMDYDFTVSGSGSGRTVTVTHARGTMEDGTDTLTGVEWAQFSNGELIDLTVEDPGCKGQDIAFVIDTTGSMWDDLAYVQAGAGAVINALFDPARGFTDSRVAVVTFNDPAVDVVLGFTDHEDTNARKAAALAAINSLSADGGGDLPEYTFTGLLTALNGSIGEWREDASSRKIVLFGDATAKDAGLASQVYTLAANVNATVSGASAAMAVDGLSLLTVEMSHTDALTGETFVVPVQIYTVAIGGYFPAIAEYREIAEMTGGIAFQAPSAADLVDALLAVISLPIYNIRFDQSSVVEGDEGTQLVTVTLTRDVTDDASTVTFSSFGTADGSDVTGMPGSIDFAAGQRSVSFTVEVHGDTDSEPDETFGISIDTISENASFTNRTASLTIVDDDAPPAVKVLDQSALDFDGHGNFPFVTYEEGEGPVAVHQVPFREIVDPDDALPWDIFALDSTDASGEFADFAALTQYGVAVFDGDDKPGNGNNQGIDGDERLVFEIENDAAFDFATSATIQLSPTRDGSTSGQADFYLDGVLVATVLADANGTIDSSFDGTGGFDRVEISALGDGLFTVDNVSFGDLYAYDMLLV